ncbi:uncharacterized protein RJT20DRAFT_130722 [Scheffersomyces xylosifermentans]|uniref:uncharacterized protein n=1 Tax=Scheffersomyces xylosifermentans TaxID=1304137 RepID=UPI00315CD510
MINPMADTVNDSTVDRKSRLAALRKKRLAKDVDVRSSNKDDEVTAKRAKTTETASEIATGEKVNEEDGTGEKVDEEDTTGELPKLNISENETIEAVSLDTQREILHNAEVKAGESVSEDPKQKEKSKSSIYTEDLKSDIEHYLKKAKFRTDRAINSIIQQKYEAS